MRFFLDGNIPVAAFVGVWSADKVGSNLLSSANVKASLSLEGSAG
jgi:hypothetical protein